MSHSSAIRRSTLASCLIPFAALALAGVTPAQVIHVDASAASGGDGSTWSLAFNDLQVALAAINPTTGGEIWVAEGVYKPGATQTATFNLPDQLYLYGGFIGNETSVASRSGSYLNTILSGDVDGVVGVSPGDCLHVVTVNASVANDVYAFDGFTIEHGNANGHAFPDSHGGGMLVDGSSSGGGVAFQRFRNVTIRNCSAKYGGGLAIYSTAAMPLALSNFIHNTAEEEGGGIWIDGWRAIPANGALANRGHNLYISGNRAKKGGGIYIENKEFSELYNCNISSNLTTIGGGGVWCESAENVLAIRHCTIGHNLVIPSSHPTGVEGAGIYAGPGGMPNFDEYVIENSIIWENASYTSSGKVRSSIEGPAATTDSIVSYSDLWTATGMPWPGNGNIFANPQWVNPTQGNFRLVFGSPCINSGSNALIQQDWLDIDLGGENPPELIPLDLDLNLRIGTANTPITDMGCYEWGSSIPL